ncbi:MAG: glycosyltransferase [Neisseriaceae bacterium]|nr:glycosyltransferase [Neisseriaceae bacterium]
MNSTEEHLRFQLETLKKEKKDIAEKVDLLNKSLKYCAAHNKTLESQLHIANANVKNYHNFISYKLGRVLLSTKTFRGFLLLPLELYKLRREFIQSKYKNISAIVDKALIEQKNFQAKSYDNAKVKFISILDEISHASWGREFKLFEMNIDNYQEQLNGSTSQAIFLESCWKGNYGRWIYAFTSPGLKHKNAQHLLSAIEVAKKKELPIIFWNKEDPMHYEKFLPIAQKCDVIFTTDENKVTDYKRDIPNAYVAALPFAANEALCNPKDRFRNSSVGTICFAGSYYSEGHDDRKEQMDKLLPVIPEFNGIIYDRMSNIEGDRYAYPPQYKPFIKQAVPFTEIVNVYKQFKIFLNVNTITDSPTMMSRRVYELLACGTPVISTPSKALEAQFPDIVQVAKNAEEAIEIAKELLSDEWRWSKLSHLGYREVMLKHTYRHRKNIIENSIGIYANEVSPLVSIILATNRPEFQNRIVENIVNQVHRELEVILILQNYTNDQKNTLEKSLQERAPFLNNIIILTDDTETSLGERLNNGIQRSEGDYIAKMDDDDFYYPNYIQDMLIPFSFGDYGIVGKKEIFVYLESENKTIVRFKNDRHRETDFVAGATLVISRDALQKIQFGDKNRGEDSSLLEQAKQHGIKVYATDPFNFIVWRGANKSKHTWQVDDKFFLEKGEFVSEQIGVQIANI